MAPPTPIGQFVPPVTGIHKSFVPVANMFDTSGNFRSRAGSLKRRRAEGFGALDDAFDLSQPYPPLKYPTVQGIDLASVNNLLIAAAKERDALKPIIEKSSDTEIGKIAKSVVSLYSLIESIVEKAVVPVCSGGGTAAGSKAGGGASHPTGAAGATPSAPPRGEVELREAMEKADRESIVFDANLGNTAIFNRAKLSSAFSLGLKNQVANAAPPDEAAEAVRILDDAYSCVEDVDFLGQTSKKFENPRDKDDIRNGTFHTMPVKLRFPDRESRIYFENTLRKLKGPRISQSLPQKLRKVSAALQEKVKSENPGKIVMIRPDTRTLTLNAFVKTDGDQRWERVGAPVRITPQDVLPHSDPEGSIPPDPAPTILGSSRKIPLRPAPEKMGGAGGGGACWD